MPAKIQTEQRRSLAAARHAAKEGNAELAREWLQKANDLYPVTRKQRQSIQNELSKYERNTN